MSSGAAQPLLSVVKKASKVPMPCFPFCFYSVIIFLNVFPLDFFLDPVTIQQCAYLGSTVPVLL